MGVKLEKESIYLDSLVIVGFNLYPKCIIHFDKTFTSLFGKNGVGKTTLLDAIQTGLIANQQYTKFNVTTQKDDRSLGDYMLGSAGYIFFNINKFQQHYAGRAAENSKTLSFGIRLIKNPDTKVDIKPIALENVTVAPDDFFEGNRLIENLAQLNKHLLSKYPNLEFRNFQTVTEYHQYLYNRGVLAINISSKISEFSTLYRSISTGILRQGKKMIKDVLSSTDSSPKKLIQSLTKSIRQRSEVVRKIERIKAIRDEVYALEEAANKYHDNCVKYYSDQLNKSIAKLESMKTKLSKNNDTIENHNRKLEIINADIDEKNAHLQDTEEQLEKLLQNISDFERSYAAFEEYTELLKTSAENENRLKELTEKIRELENNISVKKQHLEDIFQSKNFAEKDKIKIEGELKALSVNYENYNNFIKYLQNVTFYTKDRIDTVTDFEKMLDHWNQISRDIESLPFLKKEYKNLTEKLKIHNKAVSIKNRLSSDISFESKEELNTEGKTLESELYTLKKETEEKEHIVENIDKEINELLKGKIVLPEALKNFNGQFLYKKFDDIPLDESEKLESLLGDMKYAAVVSDSKDIYDYANGSDKLFFVTEDIDTGKYSVEKLQDGYLIHDSKEPSVKRYEPAPKYPVIGEKSRKARVEALRQDIKEIKTLIEKNNRRMQTVSTLLKDIYELDHIFDYLYLKNLTDEADELKKQIEYIEEKSFVFNKVKDDFQQILRLKYYFGRSDYKDDYEKAKKELTEIKKQIKNLDKDYSELRSKINELESLLDKEKNEFHKAEKIYNKNITIKERLEDEFPRDILLGKVDFSEIETLRKEKSRMSELKNSYSKDIDRLKDERREIQSEQKRLVDEITRLRDDIEVYEEKISHYKEVSLELTGDELSPKTFDISDASFYESRGIFEKEMTSFLHKYDKDMPKTPNILDKFNETVVKVFPNFQSLTKLQEDLEKLNVQLLQIEDEIKQVIGNFKSGIEENIFRVKRTLRKLNSDLENVHFGKIRQIKLRVEERPAYHKLQHIHQSDSIMSLLESEDVDFDAFIKDLGRSLGYSRSQVNEDDVLDYRNYFDIEIDLFDNSGNRRNKGLSNGENLGTNIVIVLSMLTRFSEESLKDKMLPIVLDEADRLDVDSINTLYEIAENWGLQLIVALPNIPNFNRGMHYHLIASENGVVMPHTRFEGENA
ncbi:hypothetical protein Flexsi_0930 [Flexistipes sinusarabici DSM 4947]|uniref:Uncharacterized protein n=1 Tax=Flexistipes sinusarabici (strain ATCC 49648 / DSM 4947 / MAS 10) TaxID=717231 RepID=F8E595_FLESM|nr:SbcC/MukB-like Walker B domain-containing protein [Flexistipes sinusarabici]AEI14591.1 hypothetical protein Flexsi_0930 [Flexistipes sinusarabici DSM 4947]